jgi:hypothetical protein
MRHFRFFSCAMISAVLVFGTVSCHRGTGCPINEQAHIQPNKKGKYPKSKTRSGLFPKGMYKRG